MKKFLSLVVLGFFMAVTFTGCYKGEQKQNPLTGKQDTFDTKGNLKMIRVEHMPSFPAEEVSPYIYDDGKSAAFIAIAEGWDESSATIVPPPPLEAVKQLMAKKEAWQSRFPNKKIIAIADITRTIYAVRSEFSHVTLTTGILIHYEYVK